MQTHRIVYFKPNSAGEHFPFVGLFDQGFVPYQPGCLMAGRDVLFFGGGTDIDSRLYNDEKHPFTQGPDVERDKREVSAFHEAIEKGVPMVGICRGAQLLCALAGGTLIQHVTHHGGWHDIHTTKESPITKLKLLRASSSHHQMMNPFDLPDEEYQLLAYAKGRSSTYMRGDGTQVKMPVVGGHEVEPELVYFPKIKALAIQPHPEYHEQDAPFVQYCLGLVQHYFLSEKA